MPDDGKRGFWYWMNIAQPDLWLPSRLGLFGDDAKDQSETAMNDVAPLGCIAGVIIIAILLIVAFIKLLG